MNSTKGLIAQDYLRLLLMGPTKLGKTSAVIATSPQPVCVALCENASALRGARRLLNGKPFDYETITSFEVMEKFIKEAREGAKAGRYKTVVVDPFSNLAGYIEKILRAQTNNDARRWAPEYNNRLDHLVEQLFRIPAHVIIISHYMETGGEFENQLAKTGEGVFPLLAGKARVLIPAKFTDVVWMDYSKQDGPWSGEPYNGRVFWTGPKGAWGPGCRSVHGTQCIPADIGGLIELFKKGDGDEKSSAKAKKEEVEKPKRR